MAISCPSSPPCSYKCSERTRRARPLDSPSPPCPLPPPDHPPPAAPPSRSLPQIRASAAAAAKNRRPPTCTTSPRDYDAKKPGAKKLPANSRVWSEADEVRILECLAAYVEANGSPPGRSQLCGVLMGQGLDKAEFTVTEIYEKVRRLRERYEKQRAATAVALPPPGGSDSIELRKYELSIAIWGKEPVPGPTAPKVAKKEGNTRANMSADTRLRRGFEELQRLYPYLTMVVENIASSANSDVLGPVLKSALELMDDEDAGELDAKVKKHKILEAKLTIKRNNVRNEVMSTLSKSME
ncbi:hypothetical protein ACP70R_012163 [Stipagrostis hirtigluma subsp. patula]